MCVQIHDVIRVKPVALRHILREATCRLILKIKDLDIPKIISNKLLPCALNHHEIVQKMLKNGVPLDKLADSFYANEYQIHPAVRSRQSELDYLRAVARCLLPRCVSINQNLDSKVFFSLGRELLACWVLLPVMDVLCSPNWLNAMIIEATEKRTLSSSKLVESKGEKVMFLGKFIDKTIGGGLVNKGDNEHPSNEGTDFLTDQHQLYMFMQFLKREGAVDILRFYLDVDNLNAELMDPKITTDPAKLSSLQQQSETLLKAYQAMMERDFKQPVATLAEAQEDVKNSLKSKWQRAFHQTPEYFKMVYGSREISDSGESKASDVQSGTPVSRFSSKLKGAIRGAIDGAPLEATEVPTVWDAFTDEPQANSSNLGGNSTIYTMANKLRKERGQNLDTFICTFMQSIEQSTDVGEDVIEMKEIKPTDVKPHPPGHSLVFGDLFGIKSYGVKQPNKEALAEQMQWLQGPSECLIYILVNILNVSRFIIRLILGLINISKSTVDALLCKGIDKLLHIALYEPRLTLLVRTVDARLFGDEKKPEPSFTELLEHQRQARNRLSKISPNFASVADTLQSPTLNKQLMYSLFDMIVGEIYPELDNMAKV
ncbi:uncharacterized protein LOC129570086 isoform X2 [Sitodiplosis mosellana]|uniref:uncharacterized protein LOC129570086 isoform X2 n=1 Tax=Sitodiplosis mosellana TaxID=263140 RepID=UPI002444857A|nr:uncharacterized protein LOC129570086 isoform X2 [Sitodiplosis mosellana]